jgi:hypothetical protein
VLQENKFYYENYLKFVDNDLEKHNYLMNNFKRGGISHCNQKGKHNEPIIGIDICSQYPSAMSYMEIPSGYSQWVTEYDAKKYGYYHLKNLVFDTSYDLKPICKAVKNESLNWKTGKNVDDLYITSYDILYLQEHYGLIKFDVIGGLVSDYSVKSTELFGTYVSVLFEEKAQQDIYQSTNDPLYNPSYRNVIKLYLNAVTGKLVMDKSKYASLTKIDPNKPKDAKITNINGNDFYIEKKLIEDCMNPWINAGVMVYSYSKRLLFEYIRLLPNNSNDVVHIETDSIYFPLKCKDQLIKAVGDYEGDYPIAFGNALGNIKIEKECTTTSYFLNKKVYYIENSLKKNDASLIMKGIPASSIKNDGTRYSITNKEMFEKVYNHKRGDKPITIEYMSLTKTLFGKTSMSSHFQTRTVNSTYDYKEYN